MLLLPTQEHLEQPLWIAELSNGLIVYQDDSISNSWLELKHYCENNNVYPIKLKLSFYDNHVHFTENADGYYLVRGILVFNVLSNTKPIHFNIVSTISKDSDKIFCTKYILPSLVGIESFIRNKKECERDIIYGKRENLCV